MRVLVCDDDPDVGGFLQTLFGMEGWTTDLVASGEECLTHLEAEEAPDVLVLDQVMPGLTGIATAQQLREEGFAPPIILCSGFLGPELNDDVAALELIPINKIDLQALVRVVKAAVRSAAAKPPAATKAPAKKSAAKAPAKKATTKRAPAKKATVRKTAAKKTVAKKTVTKKAVAKKAPGNAPRKRTAR